VHAATIIGLLVAGVGFGLMIAAAVWPRRR
jgi:hypothetical protein